MIYVYRCPDCGFVREMVRPVADRNKPIFHEHPKKQFMTITRMERQFSAPIINCNLEKDKPENQLFRVLSKSSSSVDQLAAARREEREMLRAEARQKPQENKTVTVGDILDTGIHPSMTKEQVQNWREKHITKDGSYEADG